MDRALDIMPVLGMCDRLQKILWIEKGDGQRHRFMAITPWVDRVLYEEWCWGNSLLEEELSVEDFPLSHITAVFLLEPCVFHLQLSLEG
jgi:hypothetical protein